MDQNWQETAKKISKVIAEIWINDAADPNQTDRNKFKTEPMAYLLSKGITLSSGVAVQIDETTSDWKVEQPTSEPPTSEPSNKFKAVITIPLPVRPAGMSDTDLQNWIDDVTPTPPILLPACT